MYGSKAKLNNCLCVLLCEDSYVLCSHGRQEINLRKPWQRTDIQLVFVNIKDKLQVSFFVEIITLAAWGIWIVRNNKIFKNHVPSFASWKAIYLEELRMVSHRMKTKHADTFKEWL